MVTRVTSRRLNKILGEKLLVLDHGFIRVLDYMGDESSIVQAARVSYGKGTKSVSKDVALIRYLLRNKHTSPFEMCEIKLHVKLPIFVARQWIRHRTASVNEYSGRYSIVSNDVYIPDTKDVASQSTKNKQGRGKQLTPEKVEEFYHHFIATPSIATQSYDELINRYDVARELARINLPLSTYTEWYWKIDLHNLLHFLELRVAENTQYELRKYAEIILHEIVRVWLPNVYQAFMDYRVNSFTLSAEALDVVKALLYYGEIELIDPNKIFEDAKKYMSEREIEELKEAIEYD